MKTRQVEICDKCKHIKPHHRDIIGSSWFVCECDKKKTAKVTIDNKKPFVFKDEEKR